MANYDQRNQKVDTQVNVNFQSPSPDPFVLLNQGIKLLEAKSYQQAIDVFETVLAVDSSISYTYCYLALALLKGRRPKILKRTEVEEIDQLLNAATEMGDLDGTVQWFRALVRDDYYNGNRITKYPPPSVIDIVKTALSCNVDIARLLALLARLPMSDNKLYATLVEQLV
ncbi:MAG: hypothetical protein KME25_01215 [Symplocastrum torsivum CPER-KK1]|jgi:tetratricopeptide (TPR) repeat protein|uniref:Tetratricopeptide repeat protein n=1 Tax=Symplocastrum torsivum CPER-KK1 TaxID=450513 RepID=A0A951U7P7_9CYAN|nr:hypothetical protein [Symplocastrum torsivum CPER-KK1]